MMKGTWDGEGEQPHPLHDVEQQVTGCDGCADGRVQARDNAVLVRGEGLLHLHGLEHEYEVSLDDLVSLGDRELDDGCLHGRFHRVAGRAHDRPATGAAGWRCDG